MAVLTASNRTGPGARTITANTLSSPDTFTYLPNSGQIVVLHNPTGGALSPTFGTGVATIAVPGIPSVTVTNYAVGSIAAGASRYLDLDTISAFLLNGSNSPTVTITSGTGLLCWILQGS